MKSLGPFTAHLPVAALAQELRPFGTSKVAVGDAARSRLPGFGIDVPDDAGPGSEDAEDVLPVREEVDRAARVRSRQRPSDQLPRGHVPEAERAVLAAGHECLSVR